MGWRGLFEGWHIVLLIIVVIIVFGWKRLPDAARSVGRSMRIFKSEMGEMKHDNKSAASQDTVPGDVIHDPKPQADGRGERPAESRTGDSGTHRGSEGEQQAPGDSQTDPQHQSHRGA